MFGLIKKILIGLLTGLFNGTNHAKCTSLSNQECIKIGYIIIINIQSYPMNVYLWQCL